ncbi:MAG TPA: choice-of-anchor D domain-containing protein [Terriglobia bacterium]|nr:choice-of-anchor D domain-containing protein [Terriglobia bacterium]
MAKASFLWPAVGGFLLFILGALGVTPTLAQNNPVPFINQPLVPDVVLPGGPGFTLTVNGTGFVSSSVVNWNGSPRTTTFITTSKLTAAILGSDVATAGTSSVTVTSQGTTSNTVLIPVTNPTSSLLFSGGTAFATGTGPYGLVSADFNRDGKLDLAIANSSSNTVSVLLGNGDGTFQSHVDYATGQDPVFVATGDFNTDGIIDLAVINTNCATQQNCPAGSASILLGNGDGTFEPHVDYDTAPFSYSIDTADFNRDGRLDLAVNNGGCFYSCSDTVSILLGNGDGTFQNHVDYATINSLGAASANLGDVNNDGNLDVLTTTSGHAAGDVSSLLGNGAGVFGSPVTSSAGNEADSVVLGDLNGDSKLDLVVGQGTDATVAVLLGNGDGTFMAPVQYGGGGYSLAIGDFNGDGKLDIATVVYNGGCVLFGNGDGTFQPPPLNCFYTSFVGGQVVAGDFNNDGQLDLAVTDPSGNTVETLLQIPSAVLSSTSLSFGSENLGSSSASQPVTLTNRGSAPLIISEINIGGADPNDFSETNTCGTTLTAGSSCTINVTFTPTMLGARAASVSITDNASGSPQTIVLSGTGTQPALTLSPTSLTFPTQVVFTTSKAQPLTLTNTGTGNLTITSIAATGQFSQTNTCGTSVPPGASCTINVSFKPKTKGMQTGSITVTDNAPGSPQTVALSGCGTYIQFTPASLNFGNQPVHTTSPPKKVTISNKGGTAVSITAISISGSDPGDFAETNTCKSSLGSGATCTVSVSFTPARQGARSARLSISDNGGCSPQTVSLSGTGTP